jgi:hypothetical protein
MSESTEVAVESPKKLHWTQMPENKARLSKMRKASTAKRYSKKSQGKLSDLADANARALLLRRAFCKTCNAVIKDKYAHRISYPKHDIDWKRHLTPQEASKAETKRRPPVMGGRNLQRSAFCETCKKPYSNKYDHFKTYPTHILRQPDGKTFGKPKANGHARGVVSVLGSPVWDAAKSKSAPLGGAYTGQFAAGFKAGYDFRAGLEAYAAEQNIPIEALVASAAQVLESEQV